MSAAMLPWLLMAAAAIFAFMWRDPGVTRSGQGFLWRMVLLSICSSLLVALLLVFAR